MKNKVWIVTESLGSGEVLVAKAFCREDLAEDHARKIIDETHNSSLVYVFETVVLHD